jgi:hypothetical protein
MAGNDDGVRGSTSKETNLQIDSQALAWLQQYEQKSSAETTRLMTTTSWVCGRALRFGRTTPEEGSR